MKNIIYMVSFLFFFICIFINNVKFENISADETNNMLQTDGFALDYEFLKALSNPDTQPNNSEFIDTNSDGVLTLDELEKITTLNLSCTNCNITDWSGLNYFEKLDTLFVENANFKNVKFNNFTNTTIKELYIYSHYANSFDYIYGLENFHGLELLSINSNDAFSLKYLVELSDSVSVYIKAPSVTNIDAISSDKLSLNTPLPVPTVTPNNPAYNSTNITITGGEKITAYVGDKISFKNTFTPEGTVGVVFWSTDKEHIASFDKNSSIDFYNSPELTLWKPGTVIVTATSNHFMSEEVKYTLSDNIIVEVLEPIETQIPITTPTAEPFSKGDVNFDKCIDAEDALMILKYSAKIEQLSEDAISLGDLDLDNIIDAKDALIILKIAANII